MIFSTISSLIERLEGGASPNAQIYEDWPEYALTKKLIGPITRRRSLQPGSVKANKKGLYDYLREQVPADISKRVEWKSNDGGDVKVRDIVALSWIPLAVAALPDGVSAPRTADIYSGKGKCSMAFDSLMEHPGVSTQTADGTFELHNVAIASALKIAGDMPALFDQLYAAFSAQRGTANTGGRSPKERAGC